LGRRAAAHRHCPRAAPPPIRARAGRADRRTGPPKGSRTVQETGRAYERLHYYRHHPSHCLDGDGGPGDHAGSSSAGRRRRRETTLDGLTGRGVRLAVIDSALNPAHPHINGIAGDVEITTQGETPNYTDRLGHGAAVPAAIAEKAREAQLYALKVF